MTGSNRRPSRCKRDALPTELIARDTGNRAFTGFSEPVNHAVRGTRRNGTTPGWPRSAGRLFQREAILTELPVAPALYVQNASLSNSPPAAGCRTNDLGRVRGRSRFFKTARHVCVFYEWQFHPDRGWRGNTCSRQPVCGRPDRCVRRRGYAGNSGRNEGRTAPAQANGVGARYGNTDDRLSCCDASQSNHLAPIAHGWRDGFGQRRFSARRRGQRRRNVYDRHDRQTRPTPDVCSVGRSALRLGALFDAMVWSHGRSCGWVRGIFHIWTAGFMVRRRVYRIAARFGRIAMPPFRQ